MRLRNDDSGQNGMRRGFSLVELLVAMLLAAVLLLAIYSVFSSYRKAIIYQEDIVEVQQAGRNAISNIRNDLLMVGHGVKSGEGQEKIIFAAPWELMFNANVGDARQLPVGTTMTYGYGAHNGKTYASENWDSEAETVRFYIDDPINNPKHDAKDYSFSDYDRMIRRQVNVPPGDTAPYGEIIGVGIRYDNGTIGNYNCAYAPAPNPPEHHVEPLFTYWGDFDFDPSTPDSLWGDANLDGMLSDAELAILYAGDYTCTDPYPCLRAVKPAEGAVFLVSNTSNDEGAINVDLNHNGRIDSSVLDSAIHRIELKVTTITQNPDYNYSHPRDTNYRFRETQTTTSVEPRNLTRVEFRDCGEPPLPPSNVIASVDDCGNAIHLTWSASPDDGANDNDVLWYEVQRKVTVTGVTPRYDFIAIVPAIGQSTYGITDYDTTIGSSHIYRVFAVDCGDSRSLASNDSNSVTPASGAPEPPGDVWGFDSPCYTNANLGSITIAWQAYQTTYDSDITEYWIYRSDPEQIDDINPYPIAKLDVSGADGPNTTCASGTTDVFLAHSRCVDQNYYKIGTNIYVWRDQKGQTGSPVPGRNAGSGTPLPGSQFDVGLDTNRYHYVVRAYDGNPSSGTYECLSNPKHLESDCNDHYDIQSFDCSTAGAGGGVVRSMFTPPMNLAVEDVSIVSWYGFPNPPPYTQVLEVARLRLSWNGSLNQFCTTGQKPDWYYVYRNRAWNEQLLKWDAVDEKWMMNFDSNNVIVFPAVEIDDDNQTTWFWVDDNSKYNINFENTPFYLDTSTEDLSPNNSSSVGDVGSLFDDNWADPGNPAATDPTYMYMVSAVDGSPSAGSYNGFGASCPVQSGYTCYSSCSARVLADSGYAEQHSMHGDRLTLEGDDTIRVYWQFDFGEGGAPPEGATVVMQAKPFPSGDWFDVDTGLNARYGDNWASGVEYEGLHYYAEQDPGQLYEYSLLIACPGDDPDYSCQRRVLIGAMITSCLPGVPDWCISGDGTTCPLDAGAYCDAANLGKVVFYITDTLVSPEGEVSQTEDQYLYFRIAQWQKWPSALNFDLYPNHEFLLRPLTADAFSPTNQMTCVNTGYASFCYDVCPPYCEGAGPDWQPRFDYFSGGFWEDMSTSPPVTERRFRFQHVFDPNVQHKVTLETRISHDNNPPRDCGFSPAPGPNPTPPFHSTCNGFPVDAIYFDFETKFPCYPYEYTGFCCAPVSDYEMDPFTGIWAPIGVRVSIPPFTGSRSPWDVTNWPLNAANLYVAWDIPFIGTVVIIDWDYLYLGNSMFAYVQNIQTDMNGFLSNWMWVFDSYSVDMGFLGTLNLPSLWGGPIDMAMCSQCLINWDLPWPIGSVSLFCTDWIWPTCQNDLEKLFGYAFLYNDFGSSKANNCAPATSKKNKSATIDGNLLIHWNWRSAMTNRRLVMALRGKNLGNANSEETWLLSQDFSPSQAVRYGITYDYRNQCDSEGTTTQNLGTEAYDDQWWANLVLVCTKRAGYPDDGMGQMHVFWWSESDPGLTKDLQPSMYSTAPKFSWNSYNKTFDSSGSLPYYTAIGGGLANQNGSLGFWADPFIDWTADNYYYDNIRIIPYCGACPPEGLEQYVTYSKSTDPEEGKAASLCSWNYKRYEPGLEVPRKSMKNADAATGSPQAGNWQRISLTPEERRELMKNNKVKIIYKSRTPNENELPKPQTNYRYLGEENK